MGEFFAEAQVLVVPNTADFAASLRAQLEAAVAKAGPVVVPVTAAAVGTGKAAASSAALAGANKEVEASALGVAEAATVENAVLTKTAVIQDLTAASTVKHARAAGQAERAVAAQAASLVGLRGAALTASGPFLAATVAIIAFGKSLKEASDFTEELNKSAVVFGKSADVIEQFAKTTASSLGISEVEALRAAGVFGNLFRSLGIGQVQAAGMSQQLVRLAADLASFNNADPSRTLEALRSGLVGQARPLRVFGVFLTAARVQQEALADTGKTNAKQLTESEKVQARFNIILKDSILSQGDFARTVDRTANQARVFKANISNLSAEIGSKLLPTINLAIQDVNELFLSFQQLQDLKINIPVLKQLEDAGKGGGLFGKLFTLTPLGAILHPLDNINEKLKLLKSGLDLIPGVSDKASTDVDKITKSVTKLLDTGRKKGGVEGINEILTGLDQLIVGLQNAGPKGAKFALQLELLRNQIAESGKVPLNFDLRIALRILNMQEEARKQHQALIAALQVQFGTAPIPIKATIALDTQFTIAQAIGTPQQQLATARRQAAEGRKHLLALLGLPESTSDQELLLVAQAKKVGKGRAKAVATAAGELAAGNSEIESITGKLASDAKSASDKIKENARKAATAQQEATQAFIDAFAPKQQRLQNRLTTAQSFGTVRQQIAINQAILAADHAEINAIKTFIKNKHLHGDALKTALAEITNIKQDEFNTRLAIRQLSKPDPQALFDFQTSHLQAALSIAETTKGTKDDQRALKAIIAHDNARIAALKKIRHKTLEEKTELDNLRVDVAQRNKALKDLQGTTEDANKAAAKFFFSQLQAQQGFASNLLGNLITGSTAGLVGVPSPASAARAAGAPPEDRIASERNRQQAKTTPGPTAGQHQTTNDILIRILHALTRQNRTDQAPEAHHQRRVGAAIMDNDGIHGI